MGMIDEVVLGASEVLLGDASHEQVAHRSSSSRDDLVRRSAAAVDDNTKEAGIGIRAHKRRARAAKSSLGQSSTNTARKECVN